VLLSKSVGEVGRPFRFAIGGGVRERARGLLKAEGDGEMAGERAGEEASGGCRHPLVVIISSSDMRLGSSSFSKDETKGGSALSWLTIPFLEDDPLVVALAVEGPAGAGEDTELEPSPF
jgi:hypothetical protein